jgi:glycosyltransferase involved in cell wall biosynthesis
MPSVVIIGTRGYPSYYGGFETAVRKLAPYLVEQGWEVTVYGRHGATKDADPDRDSRVNSCVTRGIEKKSLSTLSYGLTACLDAGKRKPDVALVMNVANGFWLPLLRLRGIPMLVNVDGIEWEREKWGPTAKAAFMGGARLTVRWANELVYDSAEIARRWKDKFGRDGRTIAYGGEPPTERLPVEGLEPGKYALVVARFVAENSIAEFFEAAEQLAVDHDVVIVGSSGYGGPFDEKAEELAMRFPRVKWLGHVSDDRLLHGLWQNAGAYFHGHTVGGTNPALVQAMACGAPTVAVDTPFNHEVLGDAGVFVGRSAELIAIALDSLLRDAALQARLRARALERAKGEYTWEKICAQYETALYELIEN